ncbi:MATE efflux family protein [Russula emetica]|nr:MATE efflux family protein [Russula emetica]
MHYGTPSSLPSDYAVLSRYANARGATINDDPLDDLYDPSEPSNALDDMIPIRRDTATRRSSFPSPYLRPLQPKLPEPFASKVAFPRIVEEDASPSTDPAHSQSTAKYSLPVFCTHVLEYSLSIASVVSIGHLSTVALAACTLGTMTASVTGYSIIQGLASTLDTMLPSAWTSPQPQLVGLWTQRMAVVVAGFLIPVYFVWFNAESILLFLHQQPDVAHLAAIYLKYASIGLPAYTFNSISRRYFQSQGLFAVPTQIILVVAPINVILNYLLVWGPEPIALGFIGAPLATAISFNLISIASIIYGIFFVPQTAWHPFSRRTFTSLGVLVRLGMGGVGQTASEWWCWELIGLAASLLGPTALAAQSILLVSASTSFQAPFAVSVASAVRLGNLLGEQNAHRAGVATRMAMLLSLVVAGTASVIFLIFKNQWGYLFNDDPNVVKLVASILPILALFQVFDGLNGVSGGILRARGKQLTGALVNLSAYYALGVPFGIWLAFRRNMGLHGLWYGLTVSLIYGSAVGVWLGLRTDWNREVQKANWEADRTRNGEGDGANV